jgi:hypothetical protein
VLTAEEIKRLRELHTAYLAAVDILRAPEEPIRAWEDALEEHGAALLAMAEECIELQATFDLRWKADMRAIKRWQEAHPDRKNVWPDHADMVVWLLEELGPGPLDLGDCDSCGAPATVERHSSFKSEFYCAKCDPGDEP